MGNLNPFLYRGYYQDTETGFYYLMSRYYDTVTHRFVNADGYFTTGLNPLEANMNIYCGNNPVNYSDPTGTVTSKQMQDNIASAYPVYTLEDAVRQAYAESANDAIFNYEYISAPEKNSWAPFRTYKTSGNYTSYGNTSSSNATQYSFFTNYKGALSYEVSVTTLNIGDFSCSAHLDSNGNIITYYSVNNNGTTNSLTLGFSSTTLSVGWDTDNTVANNHHTFSSGGFEADYWGIWGALELVGLCVACPELIPIASGGGAFAYG